MHKVYAELVFLDNFTVNFLIILVASLLSRSRIRWARFAAGAAVGGAYACAVYGASGLAVSIAAKCAVSLAMCFAAYYDKLGKSFFRNTCAFFLTTFVFAGAIYALYYCFGQPQTAGGAFVINPLARYVLAGIALGAVVVALAARVKKRTDERESNCISVNIEYGGRSIFVKAYIDTGNFAREPLSGLPVVFITRDVAREILGAQDMELLSGKIPTDKLRIIPCETAAGPEVFFGLEADVNGQAGRDGKRAVVCVAKGTLAQGCAAVIGVALAREITEPSVCNRYGGQRKHGLISR